MLDSQKQQLYEFLLSDKHDKIPNPLPILGNGDNQVRVDPEEPILETGIYRDPWERKPPPWDQLDTRIKDVWDELDYPTYEDRLESSFRGAEKKERMFRRYNEDKRKGS